MSEDATASFAMDLGLTGVADVKLGADALEQFQERVNAGSDALAGMQKALRLLKGDAVGNAASITALKDKITAQRAAVAASTDQFLKLGGAFKKAKPDNEALQKSIGLLSKQVNDSSGKLSQLSAGFGKLAEAAEVAGPVGAVAVALAAVAIAGVAATVALGSYGLAAADARRSEELSLQGFTKLRFGFGLIGVGYQRAADSAASLQAAIDGVSSTVSIGRDQVAGYTQQLYQMGLRGAGLKSALEGISIAASAQGALGAQQFLAMASNARFAGVSIEKLSDDVKARLGGIVARQMLSLDVQGKKLRENFAYLFSGVHIEGFLSGLNKVTELFSANTESGKALKEIFTTIFSPIFDLTGDAGDTFADFIKGAELVLLDFLISVYPVRKWLRDTFENDATSAGIDKISTAAYVGAIAFGSLGVAAALAIAPIVLVGALAVGVGFAVYGAYNLIKSIDWTAIPKGIGQGITDGAHWAIDAIEHLGRSVIDKFRHVFDMHSPSRLMRRESFNIGVGSAEGIDDSVPVVQRAVGRALPYFDDAGAIGGAAAGSGASGAGAPGRALSVTVTIGSVTFSSDAKGQKSLIDDFTAQLVSKLQGAALQMGAAV